VRFTINVTVASWSGWAEARLSRPYLGERPAPNAIYSAPTIAMQDYVWHSRIGRLLPAGTDRWWQVTAGMDTRPVTEDVTGVIRSCFNARRDPPLIADEPPADVAAVRSAGDGSDACGGSQPAATCPRISPPRCRVVCTLT
jgi:hypothetical protein